MGKVLIKFSKPSNLCRACGVMTNVIEEVGTGDYELHNVDVTKNTHYIEEYDLTGVPTLIVFENGKEIKRHIGSMSEGDFEECLK